MIDPKELRIGNWLLEYGSPTQVTGITLTDPAYLGISHTPNALGATHGNNLDPIPLSPEILTEWCGFKKLPYYGKIYFKGDSFKLMPSENDFYDWFIDTDFGNDTEVMASFKYLHQLQNLFFSVSGNELEIKNPEKV